MSLGISAGCFVKHKLSTSTVAWTVVVVGRDLVPQSGIFCNQNARRSIYITSIRD
jgi:hypothetical protein